MPEHKVGDVIDDVSVIPTLPLGTELSSTGAVSFLDSYRREEGGWRLFNGDSGEPHDAFISDEDSNTYFAAGYNEITKLPGDEPESEAPILIMAPRDVLTQIEVIQKKDPRGVHFVPTDDPTLDPPVDGSDCCGSSCNCKDLEPGIHIVGGSGAGVFFPAEGVKEDAEPAQPSKRDAFEPKFPNPEDSEEEVSPRADVLREAEHLITGDRNKTYGPPTENFRHIADLLNTRFRHKLKPGEGLTGSDVADLMILVKVARNISDTKRDNWTDIAGYAACGYECTLDES